MTLEDSYRLLDLQAEASDEDLRRAHHDLTKVWHPDRFGHDPELRRKAEEKLKAINQAFETIRASREGDPRRHDGAQRPHPAWGVRSNAPEIRAPGRRNAAWALTCALLAILLLLRRPTPAGLAIALILFAVAIVFIARMRKEGRE